MRFEDRDLKLKGKDKFNGKDVTVKVSIPQYETFAEALAGLNGEDSVRDILNDFLAQRATGSLRSKFANFMKSAADWAACAAYAVEQAPTVREYVYTERGVSRKKQHEILDSLDKEAVTAMSEEQLRATLAKLLGASA